MRSYVPALRHPIGLIAAASLLVAGAFSVRAEETRSAAELAASIEAELARQHELLDAATRRSDEGAGPLTEAATPTGPGDPRVAPRAPEDRELPVEIFDESRQKVPAGRFGNRSARIYLKRVLDADRDGTPELERWIDAESDFIVHQRADSNYDGVIDSWHDYEWGVLVRRRLDRNDDGTSDTWETYEKQVMTGREIDRNDDGVRDGFYRYESGSLIEETHDANDDGKIDLVIVYERRRRARSSEDFDKDGRFDIWTTYAMRGGNEVVVRIERDNRGDGQADTFEIFDEVDGQAALAGREEDVDGDGQIDIVSIYRGGRLVRREIADPNLRPM
jgi:hypothetical protein